MSFRERKRKNRVRRIIYQWGVTIALAVGVAALILTFVGERTRVSGYSMEPYLHDGDQVILDKLTYRFRDPKRYEIVVFPGPGEETRFFVKRIIGLPGETIQIARGVVYVNGKKVKDYSKDHVTERGEMTNPIHLKEDEYFVLGDNRNNSEDSRYKAVGAVKRSELRGRILFRIFPLSDAGILRERG